MMNTIRRIAYIVAAVTAVWASTNAWGQVVINEIVQDQRTADSTQEPDNREFIELYNSGGSAVDITGWTMSYWQLGTTAGGGSYFATTDTIQSTPAGNPVVLPAHAYYVLGANGVANLNQDLGANIDLFPDLNTIFELRNGARDAAGVSLIDAVGIETFRNVELANANQAQLDQIAVGQTVSPTARGGFWGQTISSDAIPPNVPTSLGRFLDGRDSNDNGRDFGILPITPGASNNLPQNASHTIQNVDSMSIGDPLSSNYYASFKLPRVIDPTVVDSAGFDGAPVALNPKAIPVSPQGGKAIVAFDETGGGNAVYSKEYVHKFDLYAYIDTSALNTNQTTIQSEATTYGIGTTDPFFGTPNQAGLNTLTSTQNGNTGIGWMIQRAEKPSNGGTTTLLQLIDFNNGGDSVQSVNDWQVKQTFDLSAVPSGWHRLSIDYDPATGSVTAKFDSQTVVLGPAGDFNHDGKVDAADYVAWRKSDGTQAGYDLFRANFGLSGGGIAPGLVGNFYVGYRENLPGDSGVGRPPTYDMIGGVGAGASVPEPCGVFIAIIGIAVGATTRRKR